MIAPLMFLFFFQAQTQTQPPAPQTTTQQATMIPLDCLLS